MAIALKPWAVLMLIFYIHWWSIVVIRHQRGWATVCGPFEQKGRICTQGPDDQSFKPFLSYQRKEIYLVLSMYKSTHTDTHAWRERRLSSWWKVPMTTQSSADCGADITWMYENVIFDWIIGSWCEDHSSYFLLSSLRQPQCVWGRSSDGCCLVQQLCSE